MHFFVPSQESSSIFTKSDDHDDTARPLAQCDIGLTGFAAAVLSSPPIITTHVSSALQSRKASETDKEKKGLEARADSIGSGRAIPIKQVSLSRSLSLARSLALSLVLCV